MPNFLANINEEKKIVQDLNATKTKYNNLTFVHLKTAKCICSWLFETITNTIPIFFLIFTIFFCYFWDFCLLYNLAFIILLCCYFEFCLLFYCFFCHRIWTKVKISFYHATSFMKLLDIIFVLFSFLFRQKEDGILCLK